MLGLDPQFFRFAGQDLTLPQIFYVSLQSQPDVVGVYNTSLVSDTVLSGFTGQFIGFPPPYPPIYFAVEPPLPLL